MDRIRPQQPARTSPSRIFAQLNNTLPSPSTLTSKSIKPTIHTSIPYPNSYYPKSPKHYLQSIPQPSQSPSYSLLPNLYPSHNQSVRLNYIIGCALKKQEQWQQFCEQQLVNMQFELGRCRSNVSKCVEAGYAKVEELLVMLQEEFNTVPMNSQYLGTNTTDSYDRTDRQPSQNKPAILKQFLTSKLIPHFQTLHSHITKTILTPHKQSLTSLQQKLSNTQNSVKQQQKQNKQQMVKLIDLSNQLIQNLQSQVESYGKICEHALEAVQDCVQKMDYQIGRDLEGEAQERAKEDKMVEVLIQKIIYKMSYL